MARVRFAPEPTGFLHIGGARTFTFNWLYARTRGGQVVPRIDDTDVERSDFTEQNVEKELRDLAAENRAQRGLLINGVRAALTGQPVEPSALAIFEALGKERVVRRLRGVSC